jgi:hypothetical protein
MADSLPTVLLYMALLLVGGFHPGGQNRFTITYPLWAARARMWDTSIQSNSSTDMAPVSAGHPCGRAPTGSACVCVCVCVCGCVCVLSHTRTHTHTHTWAAARKRATFSLNKGRTSAWSVITTCYSRN